MLAERVDEPAALLLAALEAVRTVPPPLGGSAARLSVLAHVRAQLDGVYLQAVAEVEADGTAADHDCRGAADLLTKVAGLPVSQSRSDAGLARRLAQLPGLLGAVATGRVPLAAARLVARAWVALPSGLRDHETGEALLDYAAGGDLAELAGKVDELVAALQPDAIDRGHADAFDARDLALTDVGDQTALRGVADRLDGEWLRDVLQLRVEADRGGPEDARSQGQRMFDALLRLVRGAADGGLLPSGDASSPQLVVVAPVDALLAGEAGQRPSLLDALDAVRSGVAAAEAPAEPSTPGATLLPAAAQTRRGTRIGPRTLQRLCCDATLTRLLLDPAGHPLDSTPERRQLTRRERRALEHRDGYRCQRRGCRRPASSCDPHHVRPWHLGGRTVLANMLLLCRACHHQLHDRQAHLPLADGRVIGPRGWVKGPERPPPLQL